MWNICWGRSIALKMVCTLVEHLAPKNSSKWKTEKETKRAIERGRSSEHARERVSEYSQHKHEKLPQNCFYCVHNDFMQISPGTYDWRLQQQRQQRQQLCRRKRQWRRSPLVCRGKKGLYLSKHQNAMNSMKRYALRHNISPEWYISRAHAHTYITFNLIKGTFGQI